MDEFNYVTCMQESAYLTS